MPSGGGGRGRSPGGGKWAFDQTALDLTERQCQLAINHTLRGQGNRSLFDLRLKEISHLNPRLGADLRQEHHLVVRFYFNNGHNISLQRRPRPQIGGEDGHARLDAFLLT